MVTISMIYDSWRRVRKVRPSYVEKLADIRKAIYVGPYVIDVVLYLKISHQLEVLSRAGNL